MSEPLLDPTVVPLRRLLPRWGELSRGECDRAVAAGRIRCNDVVVFDPALPIDTNHDRVTLDGVRLGPRPRIYLKLNKPSGVVTTLRDPLGRRSVRDLVPNDREDWRRAKPVGRLDRDSTGLLLLTTDGDLHFAITGPGSRVEKEYRVVVHGAADESQLAPLAAGIELDGECLEPMLTMIVSRDARTTTLAMTLVQGRFRQIRRALARIGKRVVELERVRIGSLRLGELPRGAVEELTPSELLVLRQDAGLSAERV